MIRVLTLVAAVIALATVVGLIVLWPGHVESQVAQGITVDSEKAKVDTVQEAFCAGIATLVGSIGLITAVPITTGLAALLALSVAPEQIEDDDGHGHAH